MIARKKKGQETMVTITPGCRLAIVECPTQTGQDLPNLLKRSLVSFQSCKQADAGREVKKLALDRGNPISSHKTLPARKKKNKRPDTRDIKSNSLIPTSDIATSSRSSRFLSKAGIFPRRHAHPELEAWAQA